MPGLSKRAARLWAPILGEEVIALAKDGRTLRWEGKPKQSKKDKAERTRRWRAENPERSRLLWARQNAKYQASHNGTSSAGQFHSHAEANACDRGITEGISTETCAAILPRLGCLPCPSCGTWTTDLGHCEPFQWDQIDVEDEPRVPWISRQTGLMLKDKAWQVRRRRGY